MYIGTLVLLCYPYVYPINMQHNQNDTASEFNISFELIFKTIADDF